MSGRGGAIRSHDELPGELRAMTYEVGYELGMQHATQFQPSRLRIRYFGSSKGLAGYQDGYDAGVARRAQQ